MLSMSEVNHKSCFCVQSLLQDKQNNLFIIFIYFTDVIFSKKNEEYEVEKGYFANCLCKLSLQAVFENSLCKMSVQTVWAKFSLQTVCANCM